MPGGHPRASPPPGIGVRVYGLTRLPGASHGDNDVGLEKPDNAETGQNENIKIKKVRAFTEKFCAKQGQDPSRVERAWSKADRLHRKWLEDPTRPAHYPPGSCAGPKALVLALDDEASASGMTEQWFHSARQREDKVSLTPSDSAPRASSPALPRTARRARPRRHRFCARAPRACPWGPPAASRRASAPAHAGTPRRGSW